MQSLDYFWLQYHKQIFIARCGLDTGEVVGRLSYVPSDSGTIVFAGRHYRKVNFRQPTDLPDSLMLCSLPREICLAIPRRAIAGLIEPREEFPRVHARISDRAAHFLDTLLKETGIPDKDVAVIGSQLFQRGENHEFSDLDVAIYGQEHIEMLKESVQRLLLSGVVTKLPLDQDSSDLWRAQHYRISPSGMQRIRTTQWFRKLLWSGIIVTLCFAPRDSYKVSLTLLEPEAEATGWVVQNRDAYLPPFVYEVEPCHGYDVGLYASFAWCFRHAFAIGERISARGTIANLNGKRCLWIWRNDHYLRLI